MPSHAADQPSSLDDLDPAVAAVVRRATTVLVPVDDGNDPARERARQVAVSLAAMAGARLVLLDRSDTTYADSPREFELDRAEVEAIGRPYLLDQIDAASEAGVSATAFQHSLPGAEALTDAINATHADLVVVPQNLDKPGLLDRLRGGDVADRAQGAAPAGVPVVAVADDGSLALVD
ncbi:MAG: universal stress protein [Acidimicrobiales bacterium]